MKQNNLNDLFMLLQIDKAVSSDDHFLFLLGSQTTYTPTPDECYRNGESLSYIAQFIAQKIGEVNIPLRDDVPEEKTAETNDEEENKEIGNTASASAAQAKKSNVVVVKSDQSDGFLTESVDLLNGPGLIGTEVGTRIARALYLALRAVATGKTTLQIAGHSRGAVEAILVIHELERIKNALDPDKQPSEEQKQEEQNSYKTLYQILMDSPCPYTRIALEASFQKSQKPGAENIDTRYELFKRLSALKISAFLIDPVPGDSSLGIPFFGWLGWHDARFYQKIPCANAKLLICRDERSQNFRAILPEGITPEIIPGYHGTPSGRFTNHDGIDPPEKGDVSDVQKLLICQLLEFFHLSSKSFFTTQSSTSSGTAANISDLVPTSQTLTNSNNALIEHPLNAVAYGYLQAEPRKRQDIILRYYEQIMSNDPAYRSLTQSTYFKGYRPEYSLTTKQRIVNIANGCIRDPLYSEMESFINVEHAGLYMRINFEMQDIESADPTVIVLAITANIKNLKLAANGVIEDPRICKILNDEDARPLFFNSFAVLIDAISQKYLQNHLTNDEGKSLMRAIRGPFEHLKEIEQVKSEVIGDSHKEILTMLNEKLKNSLKETIERHAEITTKRCLRLSEEILASDEFKNESEKTSHEQQLYNIEQLYSACKMLDFAYDDLNSLLDENKKLQFSKHELKIHCNNLVMIAGKILYSKKLYLNEKPKNLPDYFYKKVKEEAEKLNAPTVAAVAIARMHVAIEQKNEADALRQEADALRQAAQDQAQQETLQRQAAEDRAQQLTSKIETTNAYIIHHKLIPLTEQYLARLNTKAKFYYPDHVDGLLPIQAPNLISDQEALAYAKLQNKQAAVHSLLGILNNSDLNPSERIQQFAITLHEKEAELKLHRDAGWKHYSKACLAIIALITTGILPGLIGLAIYVNKTGRSPLFFGQSHGQRYIQDSRHLLPNEEMQRPEVM